MPVLDPPTGSTSYESLLVGGDGGIELNAGIYALKELHMPPPPKRPEWVQGDRDGQVLVRDPYVDNREITGVVEIAESNRDLAQDAVGALWDWIEEAEKRPDEGIPVVWTAADGTRSLTFYMLSGALGELAQTIESGYFATTPLHEVPFTFTCKPYGYYPEIATVVDDFSTDTSADYTVVGSSGTFAISGGHLSVTSGSPRFYYNALGFRPSDLQCSIYYTTGASVSGGKDVRLGKRIDDLNRVIAIVSNGSLVIRTVTAGVESANLGTTATPTLAPNTTYILQLRVNGNVVTAEHFTTSGTTTLAASVTATAPSGFGRGVPGDFAVQLSSLGTDWTVNDFTIEPNLVRSTDPMAELIVPGVPGDAPAEGRLIVDDRAGQDRNFLEYGLESRYANLGLPLLLKANGGFLLDAGAGFAGSVGAVSGAYDGYGITAAISTTPVAVCGIGSLAVGQFAHVGTYRVKAFVKPATVTTVVRLNWRDGSGPLRANPWQSMQQVGPFIELDLGTVTITEAKVGPNNWQGRIEAQDSAGASTLIVGGVRLVPAGEAYAKYREPAAFETPTVLTARDEFDQSAGNLNGKTAPQGGTWATSGDTGDFTVDSTFHVLTRSAAGDTNGRFAVLGTTALAASLVQVDLKTSAYPAGGGYFGVALRYIDANNYAAVQWMPRSTLSLNSLQFMKVVAGVPTQLPVSLPLSLTQIATPYRMRAVINARGAVSIWFFPSGGSPGNAVLCTSDSDLATGGVLASGKPGLLDESNTASTRTYDNFLVAVPSAPPALYANRSVEFRSDGALRFASTGAYEGPISPRGSEFYVPPAGSENRTARIVALAHRNDLEASEAVPVNDALQIQAAIRPRAIQVPR